MVNKWESDFVTGFKKCVKKHKTQKNGKTLKVYLKVL